MIGRQVTTHPLHHKQRTNRLLAAARVGRSIVGVYHCGRNSSATADRHSIHPVHCVRDPSRTPNRPQSWAKRKYQQFSHLWVEWPGALCVDWPDSCRNVLLRLIPDQQPFHLSETSILHKDLSADGAGSTLLNSDRRHCDDNAHCQLYIAESIGPPLTSPQGRDTANGAPGCRAIATVPCVFCGKPPQRLCI